MKKILGLILLVVLSCDASQYEGRTSLENFLRPYRTLRHLIANFSLLSKQRNHLNNQLQSKVPESVPFPCDVKNTRSLTRPQSVHQIKPGDIDVIAAMGDSIITGLGATATNLLGMPVEDRGITFAIGGQGNWRTYTTLPNILKVFNPRLIGYSLNSSMLTQAESQLNVAELAAISADTPYMAKELIRRIKADRRIDVTKDWKLITFLIGTMDFCAEVCYYKDPMSSLDKHRNDLTEVLRLLRNNLPRTIVNVIPLPNIRPVVELKTTNPICHFIREVECPCLFGPINANKRNLLYNIMRQWQQVDIEVASRAEFDTDDFTVVVQPFTLNYTFPESSKDIIDDTYLAPDCCHWSQKMHARVTNDLWNNLMEPVGEKSSNGNDFFKKIYCPTEQNPYIFTRRNSFISEKNNY